MDNFTTGEASLDDTVTIPGIGTDAIAHIGAAEVRAIERQKAEYRGANETER